jgi:hypothetical protein
MAQSTNNHRPRAARAVDKVSLKAREDRSVLVGNTGPACLLWQANAGLAAAGGELVQAGVDLAAAAKAAQVLAAALETARQEMIALRIAWDEQYYVYVTSVELYATTPGDITALGLALLDEAAYKLGPPDVTARYDRVEGLIRLHVKGAGRFKCRIEVSSDPLTPGSFQALVGNTARRALAGYPPGGYWVRAALLSAGDQSDFSEPVFVLVS